MQSMIKYSKVKNSNETEIEDKVKLALRTTNYSKQITQQMSGPLFQVR